MRFIGKLPITSLLSGVLLASCAEEQTDGLPVDVAHASAWTAPPSIQGAEQCMDCHEEIVQQWSQTGMARTLGPVLLGGEGEPGELDGVLGATDSVSGFQYHFAKTPDHSSYVLGETHRDNPGFALGYEVLFGIGSSELDRSYAVAHGKQMWFAPMEVLTEAGGRHGVLSPGAAIARGSRLGVPLTAECLGCHTDSLPPAGFPLNTIPSKSEWSPRGISCNACHGAGEEHVAWQESLDPPEVPDPILRVSQLGRKEQLSICAACHLQGDARLVLNSKELGPPPPGGDLLEQRALFVADTPTNEVGFVSQVERLALSECFLQSEMSCTTCHDPHRTLHGPAEREIVRDACSKCHATEMAANCGREFDLSSNDCASCHMSLTGVFDVAKVRIHDHYIRKDISDALPASTEAELRFAESPTGDWRRFAWPGERPPSHQDDLGLWMMALAAGAHVDKALTLVDAAPGPAADALPMYHHVRGSLLGQGGRTDDAIASYRRALFLDPDLAPSAINLGLLLAEVGQEQQALALLTDTLKRFPQADGAFRNRAIVKLALGDKTGFGEDLERAFAIAPTSELAMGLAKIYGELGEPARRLHWQKLASQLSP